MFTAKQWICIFIILITHKFSPGYRYLMILAFVYLIHPLGPAIVDYLGASQLEDPELGPPGEDGLLYGIQSLLNTLVPLLVGIEQQVAGVRVLVHGLAGHPEPLLPGHHPHQTLVVEDVVQVRVEPPVFIQIQ